MGFNWDGVIYTFWVNHGREVPREGVFFGCVFGGMRDVSGRCEGDEEIELMVAGCDEM